MKLNRGISHMENRRDRAYTGADGHTGKVKVTESSAGVRTLPTVHQYQAHVQSCHYL